jgi:hypothetical protein
MMGWKPGVKKTRWRGVACFAKQHSLKPRLGWSWLWGTIAMFRQPRTGLPPRAANSAAIPDFMDVFVYTDDVVALAAELADKGADILHGPTERAIWNGKELAGRD